MTLRELFSFGPFQIVMPWWIGGLILMALWMGRPSMRIAAVTTPGMCATLIGALAGMLATIARARYVRREGAGRLLVIVSIALGVAVGYLSAQSAFQPMLEQGCDCGPLVATRESDVGRTASFALPVVLWLVWCRWLFAGLKGGASTYDATRIVKYGQQLMHILPLRLIVTLVLLATIGVFVQMRVVVKNDLTVDDIMTRLRGGGAAALQVASSPRQLQKVENMRKARAVEAERRLAEFDLDGARPLVRDAACTLMLPGKERDAQIVEAEEAFDALDREIASGLATFKPSDVSGRTLLALVPMRVEGNSARLPFLWSGTGNIEGLSAATQTGRVHASYQNHKVLDAWVTTAQGGTHSANAAVAMKILGRAGIDAGLAEVVSRRLGVEPLNGVTSVGAGAMCAMWSIGNVRIRLGPAVTAETEITPKAPLWLTYYEVPITETLRAANALPPELVATYDCGMLQVQSHLSASSS